MILLLLACFSPSNGSDWSGTGGWAKVDSPPGHEDQECWVWVMRGNPAADALGGPECFPQAAPFVKRSTLE